MKKLLLVVLAVVVAASAASAQPTFIKTKAHTDAIAVMGQSTPARDEVTDQWLDGDRFASGNADSWMVVDAGKKVAYFINHKDKSYVETPLPLDLAKVLPPEAAGMLDMIQMAATVTPTPETKKIGTWNCTSYNATMTVMGMQMTMRIWATIDVPFDYSAYASQVMPAVLQGQMRFGAGAVAEFAKIKGYQVASDMTGDIMGAQLHATSEVVEITQKPAPDGIFAPPAGYTKKATLNPQDLMKR